MHLRNNYFPILFLFLGTASLITGCDNDDPEIILETGTVTDHQGNNYKTVKIGDQWWMAEDLKTTAFISGRAIDKIEGDDEWASTENPAYCSYNNSDLAPGLLYNYYVISNAEKIAPDGWHIPSDEEWKELESYLGVAADELDKTNWRGTDEGDKLKIEGTEGWEFYEGVWATNESGFSAIGGSSRFYQGPFGVPGFKGSGFWWTSTTTSETRYAWFRYLDYKKSGIFRYAGHPNYGFSIRCVKD